MIMLSNPICKNNSTWGTDIEIFALAQLTRIDIWVNSSETGNKWMVFSGRGASLMDAIKLPPVNTAGLIYLYHNGVHYEPILRVDKAKAF